MTDSVRDPAPIARLCRIRGRVQGVWYRAWTLREATARGLSGWVRNRGDGSVEALFVGPPGEVAAMIEACRRGPPAARVERIDCEDSAEIASAGFRQRPDA